MKYELQKHLAKFLIFPFFSNVFSAGVLCLLPTEIFIQSYRPAAYVFNGASNWIQLFFLGLVFPFIVVSKAWCVKTLFGGRGTALLEPRACFSFSTLNGQSPH